MNIKWIVWIGGILLAVITMPAMAWQCLHGFVELGDSLSTVRHKCGVPDFVYPGTQHGGARSANQRWYYNPGAGGFVRVLLFRAGKLSAIDTGGYGFTTFSRRCTPADLRQGMNVYELVARCGKPQNKHLGASGTVGAKHKPVVNKLRTEIWTYDFGPQYLIQKITLVDARVESLTTASRDPCH